MRATPHDGTSREYPFTVRKLFRHWTVSFGPWLRWLFCPRLGQNDRFSGSSGTTITPPVLQRAALFASWCLCLSPVGAFFGVLGYVQFVTMLVEISRSIESMVHVLWRKHVWCLIFTYIEVVLQNQSRWGHGGMMQLRHGIH